MLLLDPIVMTRTLKVLLVEDSKVLTERLSEVISQAADVELIGAVDNELDALSRMRSERIDVMILDLHLKLGTGFGVLRAIARLVLRPKVIILTNYDLPEYKNAALALGARYFLDKARDYERIPEVLSEICASGRAISRRASQVQPRSVLVECARPAAFRLRSDCGHQSTRRGRQCDGA
jgi:DNA-binding NarL/FixJ family response regulator